MKTEVIICVLVLILTAFSGNVMAGSEVDSNTLYGRNAGSSIAGGHDNTFIGYYAGQKTDIGINNTFVGSCAGYGNTGNWNSFIGFYAGSSNTTGNLNTFIGQKAGFSNTTGGANIFIGSSAGFDNTDGDANTFIGNAAGYKNTTGYYNIFLGNGAGYKNTTGHYNTSLGFSAGYSNTTGNGNVFLGYNAGYYETGSNKLYISNSDTSTPLIYGDFSTGTVVIHGKITLQSTREAKDEIASLTTQEAMDALEGLRPVTFVYRADRTERHAGFIAEDVPDLVTTKDRKGVNPLDIVTVLTKVVQEHQTELAGLKALKAKVHQQEEVISRLVAEINLLKTKYMIVQR